MIMTGKKDNIRGWILIAVLFAAFTAIAFVIPFEKSTVFWVAYCCGVIAIMFQIYIFWTSFSGKGDARSRFYGFPIARLGVYYLVAQLIVSIIEIALAKFIPLWVVVLVNILLFVLAIIGCITAETMRDEIVRQDGRIKKSVANIRELQSLSSSIANRCNDEGLKQALKKLADEFRYSDPVTSDKTSEMELDMMAQLKDIQQAVVDGDIEAAGKLCSKLTGCLAERNRICSLSK